MVRVIHQSSLILIKFLLLIQLCACKETSENAKNNPFRTYPSGKITLPSGNVVDVFVAASGKQQQLGLSHVKNDDFKDNEGMLFPGQDYKVRQFWMPDTHFNLDIYFLNEDMYVLDIHRNMQHFPKSGPKEKIPLSKKVECMHVLELKSSSPMAKEIKPGMLLKWQAPKNL